MGRFEVREVGDIALGSFTAEPPLPGVMQILSQAKSKILGRKVAADECDRIDVGAIILLRRGNRMLATPPMIAGSQPRLRECHDCGQFQLDFSAHPSTMSPTR